MRKQKDVMPLMQDHQHGVVDGNQASRRTRTLKCSEEIDESVIQLRLALLRVCEELMATITDAADPVLNMPPKKKNPKYFERFDRPIDLTTIHANADKWAYKSVKAFDEDMLRLFSHTREYFDATTTESNARESVGELQKLYETKKWAEHKTLSTVIANRGLLLEFEPPATNELELKLEPNEDIIRCICGLFKDEGLMIECAKCQVSGNGNRWCS